MNRTRTHFGIGSANGCPVLLPEYEVSRAAMPNEPQASESPFVALVNARCLQDFLIALDDVMDMFGATDILGDTPWLADVPAPADTHHARLVCSYFSQSKPSKTTLKKTRDALEAWSISNGESCNRLSPGEPMNLFVPVEDVVKAVEDLRNAAILLAWLKGKTADEVVVSEIGRDTSGLVRSIDAEQPPFLASYYSGLMKSSSPVLALMCSSSALNSGVTECSLSDEYVRSYVEGAFSVLMSDERSFMAPNLQPGRMHRSVMSAAWSHFASGLSLDEGPNTIGVCKHCHKFFEKQRKTKQFCSNSCRISHLKKATPVPPQGAVAIDEPQGKE